MYGRRRIGKTFLIRQYFNNRFSFDMIGVLEGNKNEQMTAFHMALKSYGYKGKKNQTWLDAFFALRQLLEGEMQERKRCVIFIDELPCLDTPKAGFIHALGHFWNSWANWHSEIMLIVCGSATSWMVRNIIDDHGGLHDRVTHEMPLHPFTLAEAEESGIYQTSKILLRKGKIVEEPLFFYNFFDKHEMIDLPTYDEPDMDFFNYGASNRVDDSVRVEISKYCK